MNETVEESRDSSPGELLSTEQLSETTHVSFVESPSCSTPHHFGESKRNRKRKRDFELELLKEIEDRKEAREQRELLLRTLKEQDERAAAAHYMLRRQEAEESRRQFQQGLTF
ncbi:uncharacterized protein LOC144049181 [Vanacampus margaritifer]